MARSLPGQFETSPDSASSIGQLFVHNLPLDYYHGLPERIQGISAAAVRHVAQQYLKPRETVIVAVGDRRKIEPELEKLNLGPIEIRDPSGNPA
jgi:zinc protease